MQASFVIPAHNAAATLAEAINSLCRQTYDHWEAIIVNDGSIDDTLAIVERLLKAMRGNANLR